MHVTAIIAAGGQGRRLGGTQPKQLLSVGGRPILERSVAAFLAHRAIDAVIVALPQDLVDDPPGYLRPAALLAAGKPVRLVAGGDRRQDSVANAFGAADAASVKTAASATAAMRDRRSTNPPSARGSGCAAGSRSSDSGLPSPPSSQAVAQ